MSDTYSGVPERPIQHPGAEYLEAGGGSPLPPDEVAPASGGGGRRRGLLIGGGVAALALVGVGAWAAANFFATGAQPSEALPASTIGYASIDLDPSGGQKVEALRTLNKFPAFKEELGLDADDDIRQKLFEELDLPEDCKIFYNEDVEPWFGERVAVAAVDTGGDSPEIVVVVQVKDADAAEAGLTKLRDCASGDEASGGWVIDGDWAVVAEDTEGAQAVVDATAKGTLADDPEFKELTAAAGSAGIVTMYAAPEASKFFADSVGGVGGLAEDLEQSLTGTNTLGRLSSTSSPPGATPTLKGFNGLAITVRFDDGALEVEGAGDAGFDLSKVYGTDRGGDVVETLPGDTAAAIGVGLDEGWLDAGRRADGVVRRRRRDRGRPVRRGLGDDRPGPAAGRRDLARGLRRAVVRFRLRPGGILQLQRRQRDPARAEGEGRLRGRPGRDRQGRGPGAERRDLPRHRERRRRVRDRAERRATARPSWPGAASAPTRSTRT